MKQKQKRCENFIKSRDYRDICYFIKHVKDISFRKSLIEELGYHIGVEITKEDNTEMKVFLDKQQKIRMFISNKSKNINVAYCVILDKSNF